MDTLQGKRVLVTGADGFIGSHLVEQLLDEGCHVRALVLYNSFNSWGWLDTFTPEQKKNIDVMPGDVRDPNCMREAVKDMDFVFHLAALIAIPYSYSAPDSYIDTNIRGTLNILQACRQFSTKRVFVTSTSEVYGTAQYVPIDEHHPFQGQSPYSASKIGADRIAESFYRSFELPVTIVRPFNTYGPRQSARAFIPSLITQLLSGSLEIKMGTRNTTRDLVFVKDTARAFAAIARSEKTIGQEINIATQQEHSIGDIADTLVRLIQPKAKLVEEQIRLRPQKSEVDRLLGSNEKIRALTDWQPTFNIESGLQETIAWFRDDKNMERYKPDIYNL